MNEYGWGKWCPGQVSDTSKVTQSGTEAASDSSSLHCWFCACSLQYSQLSSFTRKGKGFLYGVVLGLLWSSMGWCKSGCPFTVTRIPVAQICLQSHGTNWEPLDCITQSLSLSKFTKSGSVTSYLSVYQHSWLPTFTEGFDVTLESPSPLTPQPFLCYFSILKGTILTALISSVLSIFVLIPFSPLPCSASSQHLSWLYLENVNDLFSDHNFQFFQLPHSHNTLNIPFLWLYWDIQLLDFSISPQINTLLLASFPFLLCVDSLPINGPSSQAQLPRTSSIPWTTVYKLSSWDQSYQFSFLLPCLNRVGHSSLFTHWTLDRFFLHFS